MPKHKKHHHVHAPHEDKKEEKCQEKVSNLSMFNNNVNIVVKQEDKEDGCTSCFKALFQALKR